MFRILGPLMYMKYSSTFLPRRSEYSRVRFVGRGLADERFAAAGRAEEQDALQRALGEPGS